MQEKNLKFTDLFIPVIQIILLTLSIVFHVDLLQSLASGTLEALACIVLIPLTLLFSIASVLLNIIALIISYKKHKHRFIKFLQYAMLSANAYVLITTIAELF